MCVLDCPLADTAVTTLTFHQKEKPLPTAEYLKKSVELMSRGSTAFVWESRKDAHHLKLPRTYHFFKIWKQSKIEHLTTHMGLRSLSFKSDTFKTTATLTNEIETINDNFSDVNGLWNHTITNWGNTPRLSWDRTFPFPLHFQAVLQAKTSNRYYIYIEKTV